MSSLPRSMLEALLEVRLDGSQLDQVLDRLVGIARGALDGADEVSITLVRGEKPWTAAYTGQLALEADELQYERGYGPCVDASLTGAVLRVGDMREEVRWPDYATHVVPLGVLSSLSVQLPMQAEILAALNCYARTPHAFGNEQQVEVAAELARFVAVAVGNAVSHHEHAQLADQMAAALASRAVIEQAKGIIMRDTHCTAEEAFAVLCDASQRSNRKLRDIAASIVRGVVGPGRHAVPRSNPRAGGVTPSTPPRGPD